MSPLTLLHALKNAIFRLQTDRIPPPASHDKQQKLSHVGSGSSASSSNGGNGSTASSARNGSKFQDVQRKWVENTAIAPASEDEDSSRPAPFKSGSTPVKSLTGRFDKENLIADYETCADATALRQLVGEQIREIESLKAQVILGY